LEEGEMISSASEQGAKVAGDTAGDAIAFWPHKRRVRFKNCPVGLFMHGDTIALMTEYATERRTNGVLSGVNRNAYIVSSGEAFWGGTSDGAVRDELMVTPLALGER
jgi:hypothetical protein